MTEMADGDDVTEVKGNTKAQVLRVSRQHTVTLNRIEFRLKVILLGMCKKRKKSGLTSTFNIKKFPVITCGNCQTV